MLKYLRAWCRTNPLPDITKKLIKYFEKIAPESVTVKAQEHHGGEPYMTPIDSSAYKGGGQSHQGYIWKRARSRSWWWKYSLFARYLKKNWV